MVGLLMCKFRKFLTELSARHSSVFLFSDDNMSKYQSVYTKLDIALILWLSGLVLQMGKFCQLLTVICLPHNSGRILSF